MDSNKYISFLTMQAATADSNLSTKSAIQEANKLVSKAKDADSLLELFPKLDNQLSLSTKSCRSDYTNIPSVEKSFSRQDLESLQEGLKKLNNVENSLATALGLRSYTQKVYENTDSYNISEQIRLTRSQLEVVADKTNALSLGDSKLKNKLTELNNALKSTAFLVSVSSEHLKEGEALKRKSSNLLDLGSRGVETLVYDIDRLISRIKSDLEERGGKRMKQAGIAGAICFVLIMIAMNWDAFLKLVENVVFVIGVIIVGYIIIKVLSFFGNNH